MVALRPVPEAVDRIRRLSEVRNEADGIEGAVG
jgi:hypothetical protein